MPHNHLVAFVKAPRLGRVKSRLARDIGAVAAWRFYRTTMASVLRTLDGNGRWIRWLAVTPDPATRESILWPPGWRRMPQGPGDLGARMARVMKILPPGPVVIIGSDVPGIRPQHIAQAFHALGRHEAVFGPAVDGGYWLVGLRRRPRRPEIFAGVRWSTPAALADTIANLPMTSVTMLETLQDIDTGADLDGWRRHQREGQQSASPAAFSSLADAARYSAPPRYR
jgi:rSAM/selenodomain-associated transferase 1